MCETSIGRLKSGACSTTYLSFLSRISMTFDLLVLLAVSISHFLSVCFWMIGWLVLRVCDGFDIFFTLQIQKHRLLLQQLLPSYYRVI